MSLTPNTPKTPAWKLESLREPSSTLTWFSDRDMVITHFYGDPKPFFNRPKDEIIGAPIHQVLPEVDCKTDLVSIQKRALEGQRELCAIHNKDRYFELLIEPRWNRNKAVIGLISTLVDRSNWRRVQDALKHSKARADTIIQAIPDMMFLIHFDGTVLDFRTRRDEDLIIGPEEITGARIQDYMPENLGYRFLGLVQKTIQSSEPQRVEYHLQLPHGLQHFEARLVLGGENEVLCIVRNMTRAKVDENARLQTEARIQNQQKFETLGVLAGGIAHEFNNLLVGILGQAELLKIKLDAHSPMHQNLGQISNAAQSASELTQQLLTFAGRGTVHIETIDLNELILNLQRLLRSAANKNTEFSIRCFSSPLFIKADPDQIKQLLMNIVLNASEALEKADGVITISTKLVDIDHTKLEHFHFGAELNSGKHVVLQISDTGVGMSQDTIDQIFDPFFTTKFKGRGLGMAAVLGILKGHNATMRIISEPGQGTCVRVLFPASADKDSGEALSCAYKRPSRAISGKGQLLVIDDEICVRALAQDLLVSMGYKVLTAKNGPEGLKLFDEHQDSVDLVLLDRTMPLMSGEKVFEELRAKRGDLPVILISGHTEADCLERLKAQGLSDFVAKPFIIEDLLQAIEQAMPNPEDQSP